MDRRSRTRIAAGLGMLAALVGALAGPALAHGGSLGGAARGPLSVARSLVAGTGGMVLAVSVALAGLRGRGGIVGVFGPRRRLSLPLVRPLSVAASALGVVTLAGVVVVGWVGPADPLSNAGVELSSVNSERLASRWTLPRQRRQYAHSALPSGTNTDGSPIQ
jgi:hypothetical protein